MTNIGIFPGWIVLFWITGILLLLGVGFLAAYFIGVARIRAANAKIPEDRRWDRERPDDFFDTGWSIGTVVSFILGAIFAIGTAVAMVPFDLKYQANYTITSTVTNVETVVDTGGKYVTETLVLTPANVAEQVVSYDMRLLNSEGTSVDLICGVSWQNYGRSADLWVCELAS
mgnify:CR=1 FL=1